jgi:phosphopentomutase
MSFLRVIWVVLDSVGIGEMPDAAAYGDAGSDTLGNISKQRPLAVPNLCALGLGNIRPIAHLEPVSPATAAYGRCALASPGKDTTTGHWEMVGIHLEKPFPVYPECFPSDVIREFEERIGRQTLGNCPASGTEIIQRLGDEHIRSGAPIVYTSADSVFQIAAHEDVIPLAELYRICEIGRDLLRGENEVGRVIARPFTGSSGKYVRTANRKDYAVPPPQGMLLDQLADRNVAVHAVGKIHDVFLGRGITRSEKTKSNAEGMQKTIVAMQHTGRGLIFTNLVDFDMLYGHRNDVEGYARALEEVDAWLPHLLEASTAQDLVILTADHGCDPTTPSTDHSREYVPLLVYGKNSRSVNLGTRSTLSDIGQTVAEIFGARLKVGESFLAALRN